MNGLFDRNTVIGALVGLAAAAVIAFLVIAGGGLGAIIQFVFEDAVFAVQCLFALLIALGLVWVCQWIRNCEWFDRRGAAIEMNLVCSRIDTPQEQPLDALAAAIKYAAITVLIAAIVVAFILSHGSA